MPCKPALILTALCVLPLGGCVAAGAGAAAGAEAASVAVFGRGIVDAGVSAVTGRDCSLVRLDRGLDYCARVPAPPSTLACTRTLADVMCWADPEHLAGRPRVLVDTPGPDPRRKTAWPKSLDLWD